MSSLAWIIFGLIAGIVAKLIIPGKNPGALSLPSCSVSRAHWSEASSVRHWAWGRLAVSTSAVRNRHPGRGPVAVAVSRDAAIGMA